MKSIFKTIAFTFSMLLFVSTQSLWAQTSETQSKATFSIETDPSTFLFNGYAAHIRFKPKNSKHLVYGAGVYAMDMPDFLVNLNEENRDKGWSVRINSAFGLFGEYYFKQPNSKWFVGLQLGVQNYKNSNENTPNADIEYSAVLIMPSIGYTWVPFKIPLYFKPWAGLGYTSKIDGENTIENLTYDIAPITSFITLHIGYSF